MGEISPTPLTILIETTLSTASSVHRCKKTFHRIFMDIEKCFDNDVYSSDWEALRQFTSSADGVSNEPVASRATNPANFSLHNRSTI